MAQAAVQSSCSKLRSAVGDEDTVRLNLTGDLSKTLGALDNIETMIPESEKFWSAPYDVKGEGKEWLRNVRDTAYEISTILEQLQDTIRTPPAAAGKMAKLLARAPPAVENDASKNQKIHMFMNALGGLTERVKGLQKKALAIGVGTTTVVETTVVGRHGDKNMIINRLSACNESSTQDPTILVISGKEDHSGIGKATVAEMVFGDDLFKGHSRLWINLSALRGSVQQVGTYIISHLSDGEEDMSRYSQTQTHGSIKDIGKHIYELLNGKKLLLILHEVWNNDSVWDDLKRLFSVRGTSTQVVVIATVSTGTQHLSADNGFGLHLHCLDPLSDEVCCTIIKQAAAVPSQDRSEDKQDLKQITELCKGIPLAAQLFGSILRFKQYREWPQLLDVQAIFSRSPVDIALELAYRCMPPYLRLCFAYCAFLTRAHLLVAKEDLIHQWIALDLVEPSQAFSARQLAEQYIRRLLDMSLLQTSNLSPSTGKDDRCGILFTMHKMVIEFAGDCLGRDLGIHESRRLPGHHGGSCYEFYGNYSSGPNNVFVAHYRLRALICLGCSMMEFRDDSFSWATCLHVLEIIECSMPKLPDSVCKLSHLGYLNLSGWSGLVTLPESIGDLTNLLHMDLSACSKLASLPESFGKLVKLVHVCLSGCSKLASLPESLGKMIKLVHVDLSGCSVLASLPESFGHLVQLVHVDLSGCSVLVYLPESFGKLINLVHINLSRCLALVNLPEPLWKLAKLEHINLSVCPGLVKLPSSFGKFTNLPHINLSGCSGLVNLPASFGKLINLVDINLSGCSALEDLPQSIGELKSLKHINLSGCSGLVSLPGSLGDLSSLLHINLSCCYGLSKLPESFKNLKRLVHLDLSFGSCFEGINTALGGLTNLEHLNLSHPCCHRADSSHLEGLKDVMGQFIRLKYLNLSMFLNPIFYNKSHEKNHEYIGFVSSFSMLEHLDLSHNIFLRDLPDSIGELTRLHTLDLSGCIRLDNGAVRMLTRIGCLNSVVLTNCWGLESYRFVVHGDSKQGTYILVQNRIWKELEIHYLESMYSVELAQRVRLAKKQNLQKLKLCWSVVSKPYIYEPDYFLLEALVPPPGLQSLELHGYRSTWLPAWLTSSIFSFNNLAEVTMEDVQMCSQLPLIGLLPNLKQVVLRRMASLITMDAGDLSGGNGQSFHNHRLSKFIIDDMGSLEEFRTTYNSNGCELQFPVTDELVVRRCPKLSFVPLPPRAQRLVISECDDVMVCWRNRAGRHGVEGPSCISSPEAQVTELVVESCRVYLSHWCLLNHLPGLRSLTITSCNNLISSPEIIGVLFSLQTICFSSCDKMIMLPEHLGGLSSLRELRIESCSQFKDFPESMKYLNSLELMHIVDCDSMKALPSWLGHLTSLQKIGIERCKSIDDLPRSIGELTNLKDLQIKDCRRLKSWCEQEESKKVLSHIRPRIEETTTGEEQHSEIQEYAGEQSEQGYTSSG